MYQLWVPSYAQTIHANHVRWFVNIWEIDCFLPNWLLTIDCAGKHRSMMDQYQKICFNSLFIGSMEFSPEIASVRISWRTLLKFADRDLQLLSSLSTLSCFSFSKTLYEVLRNILWWFYWFMLLCVSTLPNFVVQEPAFTFMSNDVIYCMFCRGFRGGLFFSWSRGGERANWWWY